ncbi:AraC family transcriptional regulator [Rurimicrobium arvi]|uniref:HTH araC/xylS-type domain-containing protein n=1 Tax=Rurimicrobium arvi TaxID=2049916 RepID=A0ABP8MVW7_9BACT
MINEYISPHSLNPAQQLLGKDVLVVNRQEIRFNKLVSGSAYTVNHPEAQLPNQFATIMCPAKDGVQGAIRVLCLKHDFTAVGSAVVYAIDYAPAFLDQWEESDWSLERALTDNNTGLQFSFDPDIQETVRNLFHPTGSVSFEKKLQQMTAVTGLLQHALRQINAAKISYAVPACSFLNNNTEQRDKVMMAREILEREFDQMLSIKELSRRVAINECYLKKGFKAMFGKTINEYQQHLRIEEAKRLLQKEGLNVSSVAGILGYSSISHFSTAFKKATNMKPCELLK